MLGRTASLLCSIGCMAIAVLALQVPIALAQNISFEVSAINGNRISIAPGGSGMLSTEWRNTSDQSGLIALQSHTYAGSSFAEYTFDNPSDPRCAAPNRPEVPGYQLRFNIGPLAAGESLRCDWRVNRAATSINDLEFGLCSSATTWFLCNQRIYMGSLPDISLRSDPAETVALGATSALVRLTARNGSTHRVASRVVTTECFEFNGESDVRGPFLIENNFPGACPSASESELCGSFTGQNNQSVGLQLGPIEDGSEASCLVRLRFHEPLSQALWVETYFLDDEMILANGGRGFDPNRENNRAQLAAAPSGNVANPLPLAPPALVLISILLAAAAAREMRRRGNYG